MTVRDLKERYDYGHWANRKLFEVMERLTPEEFTQSAAGSYGSIRNTLVHVLSAEAGWLERCGGPERGARLDPAEFPSVSSVTQAFHDVETKVRNFLDDLNDEDLDREVEFAIGETGKKSMTLGELMCHAANHGVHHRGQVALLLRMLGHAPGDVDLLFYYGETRDPRS